MRQLFHDTIAIALDFQLKAVSFGKGGSSFAEAALDTAVAEATTGALLAVFMFVFRFVWVFVWNLHA